MTARKAYFVMRWPGWLVIALAATSARAQPVADASPSAKHPAVATADPIRPITGKEQKSLTDDPSLGGADKINIASVEDVKGFVAFTFDDGPSPETTPAVLEALAKYDIPATFFIVTSRITGKHNEGARQLLHKEIESGFTVGSHSVGHANLRRAKTDQLNREVDSSVRTLSVEVGQPIAMFRPPYGALSPAGVDRLNKLGLTEVLWSIDPADWKVRDASQLRKKVVETIEQDEGGVVLMHDAKLITAKIIADIFDDLEAENCARLAAKRDLIIPVSLHYFLKDNGVTRAIPRSVQKRTDAYKAGLPERCANRPAAQPAPAEPTVQITVTAVAVEPAAK